ncbi:SA0570 family protein [Staphylococcus simiae]|uniref:Immunodominant antigen B n=1 Tax=Staphylococcus simiae CCM 7213 = CCUG 51256 TaxID=911238 RepID=G5JLV1_9STAP|nr:hypothetical protein [Staphylococcus simiae]EHJ06836.1 hypothetical protein SS7213T_12352 [Staphylococcus simiae CCM 7213 = CCUG 51256]PNZ11319.1 hypothetical protein CD113_08460 [Staphylococcus simiae]SNV62902.1 exported protein [Staphylococcus simiae]
MKKLLIASVITCCVLFGVGMTSSHAEAASGNSLETVKQLSQGDQSLEKVKIGESMHNVLKAYKNPVYSYNEDGTEHYYEFHTNKGTLLVTADGKKNEGHVKRVSMMFNHANGPTYKEVKNYVGKQAITRVHYNDVTGNFGYIQKGKASYQFSSDSPQDKNVKLYRIDLQQ